MKKILPILVVGILVLSGLGAVALNNERNSSEKQETFYKTLTLKFSSPVVNKYNNNYIEVNLNDVSTYIMNPGEPVLPKFIKSIELPFGVRNVDVKVTTSNIKEYQVDQEIKPAPAHVLLTESANNYDTESIKDEKIYASTNPYPTDWYSFKVGCGLNANNQRVTFVTVYIYPIRYTPALNKIYLAENADLEINYDAAIPKTTQATTSYDMVIIAPAKFSSALKKLVDFKNSKGVETYIKTTEEIYAEYNGTDKPEQIKYFIKDAIETNNITYVLIVGGLKSQIYAKPRDGPNVGITGWHVPVRYNMFFDNPAHPLQAEIVHDPGVITDLYYADIYKEGGIFDNWDPNGDGIIAAWGVPDVENDTDIDMYPDVCIGRLACTGILEVKNMVNKIINYEATQADPSWFKKTIVISGDGFLDQADLNFIWDTNSFPDGHYTIKDQSNNHDGTYGPIEIINVTLDKTVATSLHFNHDDNLRVHGYPSPPISEIVSVTEGDILGNTNYIYSPKENEAFCNAFSGWAEVNYTDGILHIRGKTYDPRPYGNITNIHVWIENQDGDIIYSDWRNNSEMYYEGEWITGEKLLKGKGGALYYMPEDFEKEIIWASNGAFTGQQSVIDALSTGAGFAFMSGHGSPNVWADHYPGVPGNRKNGSVLGLQVIGMKATFPFLDFPALPMNKLKNRNKLPVALIGGCHNSEFNVTVLTGLLDTYNKNYMWTSGVPVPECFSWYIVKLPHTGAIASIGNTGLGYGSLGDACTIEGLDGGICIEFFKQYGTDGHHVLGDAYTQTLRTYVETFDMGFLDHAKSLQQWVLLGDPSLMIGGYPS